MKKDSIQMYEDYVGNHWNRRELFEKLIEKYEISSILYPGSYIHITPSLLIPKVTYVDMDKKAKAFFKDEKVYAYIEKHKTYKENNQASFFPADYSTEFEDTSNQYDLLISQYAGFISQSCKRYLKFGGILVANNSHGDAGIAHLDGDYELISVANQRGDKWTISEKNIDAYFIPKKDIEITKAYLQNLGRGLGYKKAANAYVFRRI